MPERREVVVSGMRPTGRLHLGNYWGALRNWVSLQDRHDCYFFVADWHMLTTGYADTAALQDNVREMVLDWLAAGLDPEKCVIFRQSDVPQHAELALLLGMVTPLSWLENNPTWKEQLYEFSKIYTNVEPYVQGLDPVFEPKDFKAGLGHASSLKDRWLREDKRQPSQRVKGGFTCIIHPDRLEDLRGWSEWRDIIAQQWAFVGPQPTELRLSDELSILLDAEVSRAEAHWHFHWTVEGHKEINTQGFLGYPILQAADIMLYRGSRVPVGQDQLPHLELSREIARRFNGIFGQVLVEPQPLLTQTPKVPGTDGRKMSKSYGNTVDIYETPESLKAKVMSLYTDPKRIRKDDPGHPEPCPDNPPGCSVYALHKLYTPGWEKVGEDCRAGRLGCVADKKALLQTLEAPFAEFRKAREGYAAAPERIDALLADGARRASAAARSTLDAVRRAMRLR
jgi:tryptophanyl-tRNA synthetase